MRYDPESYALHRFNPDQRRSHPFNSTCRPTISGTEPDKSLLPAPAGVLPACVVLQDTGGLQHCHPPIRLAATIQQRRDGPLAPCAASGFAVRLALFGERNSGDGRLLRCNTKSSIPAIAHNWLVIDHRRHSPAYLSLAWAAW
ncbi:hypothetical protein CCHR01_18980 [Colletotrichum chrysophilum]|uniref:Uncharacterized protein n=1 Tax=Colletotrichum chrysophilum TaxID=1836956 RepID=A0AAD9E5J3_9PEZI|nr:hypothetical protein CCHR01_18980 [Colletotrichum chrysophilum]